jgi:hypothetical protein
MGIYYNSNITSDGLVFCFDGQNSKSVNSNINIGGSGNIIKSNVTYTSEYGGGYVFAGGNSSYIDTDISNFNLGSNYTIEAWYVLSGNNLSGNNYGVIFGNYGPGYSGSSNIWFFTAGLWHGSGYGYIPNQGESGTTFSGVALNAPRHILSVKSGTSVKCFYQGNKVVDATMPDNSVSTNVNWRIGTDVNTPSGEAMNGKIYLIRMYNRAFTDAEAINNFTRTRGRFGI